MRGLIYAMGVLGLAGMLSGPALRPATASPAQGAAGPAISHFTLANGLEVIVIPDRRAPVVTHMVWYKVGSADETAGTSGIAHFLEHLMFKGTEKNPAGRFSDVVSEIGGQENAFTSYDYTAYFQRVAKEHLKTLMEFESDRMAGLVLTDPVVLPERDVVLEERRSRTDSDPSAQLGEAMQSVLYANHPYGSPIIGWEHEIKALNRADALAFYDRFYTPNNAILIVAGDVTADEVKALAEATYGKVARRAEPGPRVRPAEPELLAARRVSVNDEKVTQPSLSRSYLAPSYHTAEGDDGAAIEVLAQILGGGSTSRLYRALVVDQAIAASAGSWYQGSALDTTRFGVYATPRPEIGLDKLETALDGELRKFLAQPISDKELERAKTKLVAEAVYAQDNQSSLARLYGTTLTTGGTVEDVAKWPQQIRAVTEADVKRVARSVLDIRRSVTGLLQPASTEVQQ